MGFASRTGSDLAHSESDPTARNLSERLGFRSVSVVGLDDFEFALPATVRRHVGSTRSESLQTMNRVEDVQFRATPEISPTRNLMPGAHLGNMVTT